MGNSEILREDIENILSSPFIEWGKLSGRKILITGGTGLIGSMLTKTLIEASHGKAEGVEILLLSRDRAKAERMFPDVPEKTLRFAEGSVEALPDFTEKPDYILHGAAVTESRAFVERPAETIDTALSGTKNILALAKESPLRGMVYLSSMEVYGYPEKGHRVTEEDTGRINSLDPRSSYPLSKLMCEAMCCAYASEYHVPVNILRLTQTFGPGVKAGDKRIFGYFADCVRSGEDIVLKTKGETCRSYLYTADAVSAILKLLTEGKAGEAYNAADEGTYCSIADMAESVAKEWGLSVRYDIQDAAKNGFLNTLYMDLDCSKLKELGWQPQNGGRTLIEMFRRMIDGMQD